MERPVHYAGFGRRLAATLIDTVILLAVIMPALYALYGPAYFEWAEQNGSPFSYYGPGDFLLNQLLPLVAAVYLWVRFRGTPGKRLLGCVVVDAATYRAISIKQALIRYFAYLLSILPLGLGFLWILWDKRRQGFHDKLAGTVVLHMPDDESEKSLHELMRGV